MKIVEQFLEAKTPVKKDCEDGIFVNEHYCVVIDGATSVSTSRWDDKKSGKVATELILAKLPELQPDLDAGQFMLALNQAILDWYKSKNVSDSMRQKADERCTANLVAYSQAHRQIWFLGDCQAMIDGQLFANDKLIDQVTSNARAVFIEASLKEGKTIDDFRQHDAGREFIVPLVAKQHSLQNVKDSPYSYPTLDGFFEDATTVKIIDVPE